MSSSYNHPYRSKLVKDWSTDGTPRSYELPRVSKSSKSQRGTERSTSGRPLSSYEPSHRPGLSRGSARSIFDTTPSITNCSAQQARRQRFSHSFFEVTMQERSWVDGKFGRHRKIGFIPPFPGAQVPASHLVKAKDFLETVSSLIPDDSADHDSRYKSEVATYLYDDTDQHSLVEVVERPDIPKKTNMLQLFIRVDEKKVWDSEEVWDRDSVFSDT